MLKPSNVGSVIELEFENPINRGTYVGKVKVLMYINGPRGSMYIYDKIDNNTYSNLSHQTSAIKKFMRFNNG